MDKPYDRFANTVLTKAARESILPIVVYPLLDIYLFVMRFYLRFSLNNNIKSLATVEMHDATHSVGNRAFNSVICLIGYAKHQGFPMDYNFVAWCVTWNIDIQTVSRMYIGYFFSELLSVLKANLGVECNCIVLDLSYFSRDMFKCHIYCVQMHNYKK